MCVETKKMKYIDDLAAIPKIIMSHLSPWKTLLDSSNGDSG